VTGGIDDAFNTTTVTLLNMALVGGAYGTFRRGPGVKAGPGFNATNTPFINRLGGFIFNDSTVSFDRPTIAQLSVSPSTDPFATIITTVAEEVEFNFRNSNSSLSSGEVFFRVDPGLFEGSRIVISGLAAELSSGAVGLFDTTGATGTFTAVADATVAATAITSVTDSSGVARFNFTVGPTLFVNQEVVISTFITNTDYNQTALITTVGVGFFEVDYIAFGTNETGSFLSNSVTLTDTTTTLVDDDTLTLDTDDATDYDGSARVYNQLTNSVQINKTFTATQTGTWSQAGITQQDPRVLADLNPGFASSKYIGDVVVNGNTTTTTISAANTYIDLDLGNSAVLASSGERWKVIDDDNGTIEYIGVEPYSGAITGHFSVLTPGSQNYQLKYEKSPISDGGFVDLPDAIEIPFSTDSATGTIPVNIPVTAVTGDQFKPQVENIDGEDNIDFIALSIGPEDQ